MMYRGLRQIKHVLKVVITHELVDNISTGNVVPTLLTTKVECPAGETDLIPIYHLSI